jgi:glycosyltransferase involved in cell wall biosynthesis
MLSWCLGSHIFASIAYLHIDRAHRHQSIATKLGVRRSASLSLWLYLASGGLIAANPAATSWLAATFIGLYALNVSFFKKFKSDAQSSNYERGWRNWQWLNLIVGFWLIMILLYAIDPLKLVGDKIVVVSGALIIVSLLQTLLIAHNLIGFARAKAGRLREWPKVSVIIHAHNQADNIASTILALIGQNYPELEIIFTDLQSSDNTLKIVEGYADPRIKIVSIAPLRPGWTMHAHAAAELLRHASGELIVLLSADTVLKPNAIASFASIMEEKKLDLMSLLPADQNKTLAQKLILSQNQFFLLGIYPAAYLTKNLPKFASAYAGLMIFNRAKINSIDGFALVKNSPLEDLDLASRAKINGLKTAFYLGSDIAVSQNHADLKLILEQTNRRFYPMLYFNMPLAIGLITGSLFVFCAPIMMLGYQIIFHNATSINGLLIVLIIGLVNRLIVAIKTQQSTLGALLYPLTSLIAALEIVASMLNYELLKPRWLERTEAH